MKCKSPFLVTCELLYLFTRYDDNNINFRYILKRKNVQMNINKTVSLRKKKNVLVPTAYR